MQFLPLHASVDSSPFSREGKVRYFQCEFLHFSTKITYLEWIRPFLGTSPPLGQVHCIKEPSITGKSESTLSLLHQIHFFPLPFFSGPQQIGPNFGFLPSPPLPFPSPFLFCILATWRGGPKKKKKTFPTRFRGIPPMRNSIVVHRPKL